LPEVTREFVDDWLTETLKPGGNFLHHYYRIDESHFLFDGKKCLRNTLKATDLPISILWTRVPILASYLPRKEIMDHTCQHCGELIVGNAYRVTSEDQGITLLDMVVCSLCFMEAKRLHLHAEEITTGSKQASARNRGSHHPRLHN
jgi:hypothetical protein